MIQSAAYVAGTVISEKIISLMGKKKMVLLGLLSRDCRLTVPILSWREITPT
ncbi:Uncharacterised protein [Serratia fonticola]|uniref:Uncharacterized protein n=1 Tax=Serratia fonticola TaxID=47917 RepID=A0A4U9VSF9_SERFO|nr:Uncharacterised protein [Serratia fonticola]